MAGKPGHSGGARPNSGPKHRICELRTGCTVEVQIGLRILRGIVQVLDHGQAVIETHPPIKLKAVSPDC